MQVRRSRDASDSQRIESDTSVAISTNRKGALEISNTIDVVNPPAVLFRRCLIMRSNQPVRQA